MKLIIFIVVMLGGALVKSYGQDCRMRLEGIVVDHKKQNLPGATVELQPSRNAVTDNQGRFAFSNLCNGVYSLRVNYVGFESKTISVDLNRRVSLTIELEAETRELQDVVIESDQQKMGFTQTTSSLDKETLTSLHGKPLGESLKEIPGVSAIQTGPTIFKPVIHGLHSQRILILNNGIRQEGQQWGVEHAPEVDPYIASSLTVVKGAETVRYGSDAIGGVIIVNPPALHNVRKLGGEFNLGLMSNSRMGVFSGMLEGSLKKDSPWNWRLQTSLKKAGDFRSASYNLSNTGVEELNFSGALGYRKQKHGFEIYLSSFNTEIGILRAAHTGSLDDLQSSIESDRPWFVQDFSYDINNPKQKISHQLLKVNTFLQVKHLGKINIVYGGQYNQRLEYDIRRGGRSNKPALSLNLVSNILDISLDHEKGDHSGSLGVTSTIKFNSNDTESTGIIPLIPDYQQRSAGLFVLEKLHKGDWTFEAGGRYDYQHLQVKTFQDNSVLLKPTFDFHFFSGALGISHLFNSSLRFTSNLGFSTRPPHVSELYSEGLHHGTGSIEEGLMRQQGEVLTEQNLIKKEVSKKWINSLQYSTPKVNFDFSVYYNAINNYVFLRPYATRLTTRGYFGVFRFEQTNALLMGSDFTFRWEVNQHFSYSGKASYTHASDRDRNDVLIFIPPGQFENGVTYSLEKWSRLHDLYLTVSAPITLRQSRAPKAILPNDVSEETTDQVYDFAPAPPGYVLLNAKFGFKFPIGHNDLSISFSAENILNEEYRNYMNRLRYFADDTGQNFIFRIAYQFYKH